MCAVSAIRLFSELESVCVEACESVFRRVDRVISNPRNFKLSSTRGSVTSARRNSVCAVRSSALNRRRFFSISGQDLQQPVFHQVAQ